MSDQIPTLQTIIDAGTNAEVFNEVVTSNAMETVKVDSEGNKHLTLAGIEAFATNGYKGEWTPETDVEAGGIYGYQGSEWRSLTGVSGVVPVEGDDWREIIDQKDITTGQEELIDGVIFPKEGDLEVGMTAPVGTTHLRVGGAIYAISPITTGDVTAIDANEVTISGSTVLITRESNQVVYAHKYSNTFVNKRELFDFCLQRIQELGGGRLVLERNALYDGLDMHYCDPAVPVVLDLNGSTLRQADGLGNWNRLLTAQSPTTGMTYSADEDSPLWEIMNGTLDGNRDNRTPFTGFEKEQSHLILWGADSSKKGRARLKIHPSVKLINSCGDGVLVYTNCDLIIDHGYSRACFRGGITASGGNSKISAVGFTDDAAPNSISINLEFDAIGFGGTRFADVDLTGVTTNNSVELDIRDNGKVNLSRLNMMQGSSISFTGDGTGQFYGSNPKIRIRGQSGATGFFADIGQMRLENPEIVAEFSGAGGQTIIAVPVRWNLSSSGKTNRSIELINPKFEVENKQPTDVAVALDTSAYDRSTNNWIKVVGRGYISNDFDRGIETPQGGCFEVGEDMVIDATVSAIRVQGTATYNAILKLGTCSTNVTQTLPFLILNSSAPGALILEARDAVYNQALSNYTGAGSPLSNISSIGGRWIHGTSDPTVTLVAGLIGDTYSKTDDGRRFRATANNNAGATQWAEM